MAKTYYIFVVAAGKSCGRLLRLNWKGTNNKCSVSTTMNTQNKGRFRGCRIRDKVQVIRSQNQHYPPTPNPTFSSRSHQVCHVSEPIVKIDNRIYELLSIFTKRLTRLEDYVYNTSERSTRDQHQENNLPSAEALWNQFQQGKARAFREEINVSRNQTRIPIKNRT